MDQIEDTVGGVVAQHLESMDFLTVNHPVYQAMAADVDRVYTKSMEIDAAIASRANYCPMPIVLKPDDRAELEELYPEFRISRCSFEMPPNANWRAHEMLMDELCIMHAMEHGRTVLHWHGDPFVHYVAGRDNVHCVCDMDSPFSTHELHVRQSRAVRMMSEGAVMKAECGRSLSNSEFMRYLSGEKYTCCLRPGDCTHKADVIVANLSRGLATPAQLATAMIAHGAQMVFGFFPYSDRMVLGESGTFPGLGVDFSFEDGGCLGRPQISLKYHQGVAGLTTMDLETFSLYCQNSHFPVGDEHFYLELMKVRGPYMSFRMTRSEVAPGAEVFVHALTINRPTSYHVRSWKLRNLISDPQLASSWQPDDFVVEKTLFDKAYAFGLSLNPDEFSRAALRKRLVYFNDRITVRGTTVTVQEPLSPDQLDSYTTVLFARLFVDRYEMSRLSAAMMKNLKSIQEFQSAGTLRRIAIMTRVACLQVTGFIFSGWSDTVRRITDYVAQMLDFRLKECRKVAIDIAPAMIMREQITRKMTYWLKRTRDTALKVLMTPSNWIWPTGFLGWRIFVVAALYGAPAVGTAVRALAGRYVMYVMWDLYAQATGSTRPAMVLPAQVELPTTGEGDRSYRVEERDIGDESSTISLNARTPQETELLSAFQRLGDLVRAPEEQHTIMATVAVRTVDRESELDIDIDPGYIQTMNDVYTAAIPGVALQNLDMDTASLSLDPQARSINVLYMRMPQLNELPRSRRYYMSRIKALNVAKRQHTMQETLSAVSARNLAAPQISLPQHEEVLIPEIWQNFLGTMCVPEAQQKLLAYKLQPVTADEVGMLAWSRQVGGDKVERLVSLINEHMRSLGDLSVSEYLVMIKSDVKPTMSVKPIHERTEPQVIVYHDPQLSAVFSALFRVLVRRFLSLLKPNVHVNLLKDTNDISDFLSTVHDFTGKVKYLENDFSKYDKSQNRFVFELERYIFDQLGMNDQMLQIWHEGHIKCNVRSIQTGLTLHLLYQRKSGDATTAFGNVLLNTVSVAYAYRGIQFNWAMFQGDDSLIAAYTLPDPQHAIHVLGEIFNLTAKYYETKAPYYLSNFVMIDHNRARVVLVPDPIKRIEKWSMHISAEDPQWDERYVSNCDSLKPYLTRSNVVNLGKFVTQRYMLPREDADRLAPAVATAISSWQNFRNMYDSEASELLI